MWSALAAGAYRWVVRRLAFLLRPGWLALLLAVLVFAGACFWILSPWQFGRNAGQQQQNHAIASSESSPAVPLDQFLAADREPAPAQLWHRVTVSGQYLPAMEAVARLRSVNGQPAYEVLTPFRTLDGQLLLIDRGWVPVANGRLPPYPAAPRGPQRLVARVQADEAPDPGHRPALREDEHTQFYQINGAEIGRMLGVALRAGYFQLVDGQPGVLAPPPLPPIESGPFLSYALQWIAFGVMALFGLGYFTARELRPGGALTAEGRAHRRARRVESPEGADDPAEIGKPLRGRHAVAAAIAADEAREQAAREDNDAVQHP